MVEWETLKDSSVSGSLVTSANLRAKNNTRVFKVLFSVCPSSVEGVCTTFLSNQTMFSTKYFFKKSFVSNPALNLQINSFNSIFLFIFIYFF